MNDRKQESGEWELNSEFQLSGLVVAEKQIANNG